MTEHQIWKRVKIWIIFTGAARKLIPSTYPAFFNIVLISFQMGSFFSLSKKLQDCHDIIHNF